MSILQSQEGSDISAVLRRTPIILAVTGALPELDSAYWCAAVWLLQQPWQEKGTATFAG